eukprot:TRINITY_DN3722_c0_g1_i1.p1 TRINITY_DN3722_c0_g1~~TRINITY_DN3722_c0_g1_i1.p1  ORF type:complete len:101 (-),score=6.65 TRINITY_DN3722_c0_g1_i1:641-943(-)
MNDKVKEWSLRGYTRPSTSHYKVPALLKNIFLRMLSNKFLNSRAIIDLVKHEIKVTPMKEDYTTTQVDCIMIVTENYKRYIIDKQDKDIETFKPDRSTLS